LVFVGSGAVFVFVGGFDVFVLVVGFEVLVFFAGVFVFVVGFEVFVFDELGVEGVATTVEFFGNVAWATTDRSETAPAIVEAMIVYETVCPGTKNTSRNSVRVMAAIF
jgi:hypothetical protein